MLELPSSAERPLSDRTPEELDQAFVDLQTEILRRKTTVLESLHSSFTTSREVTGPVDVNNLGARTRAIIDALGVDLDTSRDMRYVLTAPRGESRLYFSLNWVNDLPGTLEEIKIQVANNPEDPDVVHVALASFGKGAFQFSWPNSGQLWGERQRTNLKEISPERGEEVFGLLSTPFARLALAEELAAIPSSQTP
jgi:hypothetical protein